MTPAPEVVLSVTMLRPDEKLLLDALRRAGLRVAPALQRDRAGALSGRQRPTAAVIRNLSHADAVDAARRLEHAGVRTVNTSAAIELCNDKGLQALAFEEHGIAHPLSLHAYTVEQVREAIDEVGWPAVIKPVSGSWGRGICRIVNDDCLDAWVGGRESTDPAGKLFPVLVQRYVDKPGHDLRVVVVGADPVVAIRRVSDDWRTNTHLGATVEPVPVTSEIAKLCGQVLDVVGDGFYGVDLVEDRESGQLLVLEVNANPEFAKSSQVHGVDIASHVADFTARVVREEQGRDGLSA